jgi:hypothetical protein
MVKDKGERGRENKRVTGLEEGRRGGAGREGCQCTLQIRQDLRFLITDGRY